MIFFLNDHSFLLNDCLYNKYWRCFFSSFFSLFCFCFIPKISLPMLCAACSFGAEWSFASVSESFPLFYVHLSHSHLLFECVFAHDFFFSLFALPTGFSNFTGLMLHFFSSIIGLVFPLFVFIQYTYGFY